MGKVIDFRAAQNKEMVALANNPSVTYEPHNCGKAICLNCKEEWTAVAPLGVVNLDCPSCTLHKGVYKGTCAPEPHWTCTCGCTHFYIHHKNGACCALCGIWQRFK